LSDSRARYVDIIRIIRNCCTKGRDGKCSLFFLSVTYNYPQNRVTDHRIGLTIYNLSEFMDGSVTSVIDALFTHYQAERLKETA